MPEGWKEGCVGDLVNVQSGYAFKSKEWQIEGSSVIKIKNIENNSLDSHKFSQRISLDLTAKNTLSLKKSTNSYIWGRLN